MHFKHKSTLRTVVPNPIVLAGKPVYCRSEFDVSVYLCVNNCLDFSVKPSMLRGAATCRAQPFQILTSQFTCQDLFLQPPTGQVLVASPKPNWQIAGFCPNCLGTTTNTPWWGVWFPRNFFMPTYQNEDWVERLRLNCCAISMSRMKSLFVIMQMFLLRRNKWLCTRGLLCIMDFWGTYKKGFFKQNKRKAKAGIELMGIRNGRISITCNRKGLNILG